MTADTRNRWFEPGSFVSAVPRAGGSHILRRGIAMPGFALLLGDLASGRLWRAWPTRPRCHGAQLLRGAQIKRKKIVDETLRITNGRGANNMQVSNSRRAANY